MLNGIGFEQKIKIMGIDLLSKANVQVDSEKLFWEFIEPIFKNWARNVRSISFYSKRDDVRQVEHLKEHFQILMITDDSFSWERMNEYEKGETVRNSLSGIDDSFEKTKLFIQQGLLSEPKMILLEKQFDQVVSKKLGGVGQGDSLGDAGFSIIASEGAICIGFYRPYYSA